METPPLSVKGMVYIAAKDHCFTQGSMDSIAAPDEGPSFNSCFSYDFYLDSTEVTQGKFKQIMGRNPVPDTSFYGIGDDYPVYNVSWFDAVLFCNARSKVEGLDTVYTYYEVKTSPSGSVYDLTGLRIHFDINGYRLPAESEWEYAAGRDAADFLDSSFLDTIAWYSGNSGGTAHPVKLKTPRSALYDINGNVFEWTSDWKGPYLDRVITNAIGAPRENAEYERVIKGGSFEHGSAFLRPSCRSASYPTSASSAAHYIGFRCARGIIQSPTYITTDTSSFIPNPADMTTSDISDFFGTSKAKLVFINITGSSRTLCYIDYSQTRPAIEEFTDRRDVYMPVISPDGHYVAYCTRNEGLSGPSIVYIRNLNILQGSLTRLPADSAYIPRWWIDRSTNDTFIIYTNSAMDCGQPEWASTKTYRQKMQAGRPSGTPEIIIGNGGFHDGLSRNGEYAVTGFTRLKMREMSSGSVRELFQSPLNGKLAGGSTQVCNVSICPDSAYPGRCMFLDFGCPVRSTLVGTSYGVHQYIFISDYSGQPSAWFGAPSGEKSWDGPEWSNNPSYAVSAASGPNGVPYTIYVLDLTESNRYLKVVNGVTIQHPYLYLSFTGTIPKKLYTDSLGEYDKPHLTEIQSLVSTKLHGFWARRDSLQIAFIGDSRINDCVDPSRITGYSSYNMAVGGGDFTICEKLIRNYVLIHGHSIKLIAMDLLYVFLQKIDPGPNWGPGIAQSEGYNYDLHHNFWQTGLPAGFDSLMTLSRDTVLKGGNILGFCPFECRGWGATPSVTGDPVQWDTSDAAFKANWRAFVALCQSVTSHGIHFLFVETPMSPGYAQSNAYCRLGPSQATAKAIISMISKLTISDPYMHLYDANRSGTHDYTNLEAYDTEHLCCVGAMRFSDSLNTIIHEILDIP